MNDQAEIRSRSYQSGDWYGVLGPHVTVILPPQEKSRVATLWGLADEGSGFEETLDALISGGLRDLSGFVLVSTSDGGTRVVIRGTATAVFEAGGETVELDGSQATTWVERSLRDVTSMVIEVADVPEGAPRYAIEHGLVRIARLTEGEASLPAPVPVPVPVAVATGGPEVEMPAEAEMPAAADTAPDAVSDVGADPLDDDLDLVLDAEPGLGLAAAEPVLPGEPLVAFGSVDAPDVDPWIDPAPGGVLDDPMFTAPAPEPREPVVAFDDDDEPVTEVIATQARAGEEEATELLEPLDEPRDPFPPDVQDEDPDDPSGPGDEEPTDVIAVQDHDGLTRMSPWDEDEFALARPGIPGQEPAPPVTSRPVARLVISDGQRVEVDRVIVVGRAPMASRFSETQRPTLVRVSSPNQEVSSSHVEIRPGSGADHDTAVITDLGSTNGTVVAQPGLEPDELQPGVSVQLIPGAIIDLGDGVTIQVVRP